MKDKIVTARRTIDFPWAYGLSEGTYEMSTGRRLAGGYFSKSSYAYACMMLRGNELAGLPWSITRNGKRVPDHPLVEMLTSFGPESNYVEGIVATEIDLLLCAQAFWLRDYDILKRLNPTTIEVVTDRSGISEFKQTINGEVVNRFAREEVIYFREYHPDDDLGAGIPVMEVIKKAVDLERQALLYLDAFFKNDATPSILLTTPETVSTPEMEKVLTWWNSKLQGIRKAFKVAMADKGLKAQILSASLKDNTVVEIREQARGDICTGMRVPKILVGDITESTYANAQEARKYMIEDLTLPRARYFTAVINHDLVEQVDPSVEYGIVEEEIYLLQEDASMKWERLSAAIEQDVVTREYAAEQMGWPEPKLTLSEEEKTLRAWRTKAVKAHKAGRSANVEFLTDEVSASRQVAIRAKLADAGSLTDVKRVFV